MIFQFNHTQLILREQLWNMHDNGNIKLIYPSKILVPPKPTIEWLTERGIPYIILEYTNSNGRNVKKAKIYSGIVRQIPIVYSEINDHNIVTDSPNQILNSITDKSLDLLSVLDFLAFGYVNGDRTLVKNIKGMEASQLMSIDENDNVEIKDVFIYGNVPFNTSPYYTIRTNLKALINDIFDDLYKLLRGKTIVVPLSGGYDSRLIVSMLKITGLKDVICLSYGVLGNDETEVSQKVAKKLGYEWYYTEYSYDKWKEIFEGSDFQEYLDFAHSLISIPHFQELPIMNFVKNQLLSFCASTNARDTTNVVFIPGHTGDFIAGGHIPATLLHAVHKEDSIKAIISKHYGFRKKPANKRIMESITKQVDEYSQYFKEPFRIFEAWDWRERQSKFIVNANRVYEYYGYSWTIPLWDARFVKYWSSIPLELKFKQKLYDEFLEEEVFKPLGINFNIAYRRERRKMRFKERVESYKITGCILEKIKPLVKRFGTNNHFNPCGFDIANPLLENLAYNNFPIAYTNTFDFIRKNFLGRDADPNSYVSEYVLMMLQERYGLRL